MATPPATGNQTTPPTAPPPATTPPAPAPPGPSPSSPAAVVKLETPPSTATTSSAAAGAVEDFSYTISIPSYSAWFSYNTIHDTERRLLPEFFGRGSSSACRSPTAYKYYRDAIVRRFRARPGRLLTLTEARRGLVGDAGSVRRVFDFLEEWRLINYGASPSAAAAKPAKEKKEDVMPVAATAGVAAPRKLCTGCRTVCGLAYFTSDKADISLCARCFVRGNYRPGLSSTDFKRVEITEETKTEWTDKETLHLLEAVLHYGEDWKKVSEHVGSRSEKDCIARFVKLPFGEQFMGPKEDVEDAKHFENDDDNNDEHRGENSKRRRLTPLADTSNPIMSQVAFLSAIVGSDVAAAAAQAAVSAISQVDGNGSGIDSFINNTKEEEASSANGHSASDLLKEAAVKAQLQLEKERQDIEQSLSDIVEIQMKEIQDKICHFEQLELLMEKEWQQLRYWRDSLFADQLAIVQHERKSPLVTTEGSDNEKSKPIIDIK